MEKPTIDFGKYSFDDINLFNLYKFPTWAKHTDQAIPNKEKTD